MLQPGDPAVLREVFRGRVWRAFAAVVVQVSTDLVVTWMAPGAEIQIAVSPDGHALVNQPEDWVLQRRQWSTPGALRFARPDEPYSIWQMGELGALTAWYVNLEEPARASRLGWDYLDHKLDLLLYPDGTHRWKDEDELEEAVALGNFSRAQADAMWDAGKGVLERFRAGWRPYPQWLAWRPDPAWRAPSLPDGWRDV